MVTDPIADFATHILNASRVGKNAVSMPYSKLKHAIADKLKGEGLISGVEKGGKKSGKVLEIKLIYKDGESRIQGMERVSKPGRRLYGRVSDLRPVKQGTGILILSTPKGILTDREAKKENTGGELLLKIW